LAAAALRVLGLRGRLLEARAQLEVSAQAVDKLQDMTIAKEVREAELSERNAELQTMAETDGLTGLRNHRSLFDAMVRKFESTQSFAFLLIDIDWFKNFNDAYGHVAGDETLRTVGQILAQDASDKVLVARYGGEEFAVILPSQDAKTALAFGEEVRKRIERHSWPHRPITVCVGVAIRTTDIHSVEDLVRRADSALYAAKRTGKNRVLAWSQN
jgi:diguanylate cyclase (GGDEF)-like protein